MLPAIRLIDFGMRQVVGLVPDAKAREALAKMTGPAIQLVVKHFTDHSKTLPSALVQANDRAWQAVSIALAGDGFLDQIKLFFVSADDKGIREQVRLFLQDKSIGYDGTPADFRKKCLAELNLAKNARLLTLSSNDVADRAANFQKYADPKGMVDGAEQVIGNIADDFVSQYPNLAKLLRQRPSSGGSPLLVAAFSFFFRRAVETNGELARGLFFDGLRQLSASQTKAFGQINQALVSLGDQFDRLFEPLGRIEKGVLDIQQELQNLANLPDAVRNLEQEVLNLVSQVGMQKAEVKPHQSLSIRSPAEREAVKQLLARFRQLPVQQQKRLPALLNGLGKLQFGSGDFQGARQSFVAVAEEVHDSAAQAEVHFNAYRAALEEKKWAVALEEIKRAASLDSQRFAPFPMQRYQPKKILGAGGFGTAFLCHDKSQDAEVVVKTFHDAAMDRNVTDVFKEADVLGQLKHPSIIGVRYCNYADLEQLARPYIVMEFFNGISLEAYIHRHGLLSPEDLLVVARQVAQGMLVAHRQGILHRDIKPDNVLVRREEDRWKVKIIDFGLALRKQTIETSMASRPAGNTILSDSVAGTVKYAPPEQMGDMKGVKPGPYSDVYSFGKMCCYAMFKTTEPKDRHWETIPEAIGTRLKPMLDKCREEELEHRLPGFEPVLEVLDSIGRKKPVEGRQKANHERDRDKEERADAGRHDRRPRKQPSKSPKGIVVGLLAGLAAIILIAFVVWRSSQDGGTGKTPDPGNGKGGNRPSQPGQIEPTYKNSLGMTFAWIPPGTFQMGSPKEELLRDPNETPHKVTLKKGFYMGIHPVTQEQWQAVMPQNPSPSYFKGEKNLPVEQVSWNDCQEFIKNLRNKDSKAYRLPTEAEWEYACRAGTTTPFHFGETISTAQANYNGDFIYGNGKIGVDRKKTTPVGSFPANAWGLFDTHGNVWQWCQDWYGDYPQYDVVDPQGPSEGQFKVVRGGSWYIYPQLCRSAFRGWSEPAFRSRHYGLRVCFCLD